MRNRPGKLVAICVIAIVLSVFGLLMELTRAVNLVAGKQINKATASFMQGPQAEVQAEMVAKIGTITDRWMPVVIVVCLVHLAVSVGLLAGAIGTLRWKPSGRKLLAATLLAAIALDLIRAVPEGWMKVEIQGVTKEYMGKMMAAQPGGGGGAAFGEAIGSFMVFITLAYMAVWILIKIVYYAVGVRYLNKPETRALFATTPSPATGR